MVLNLVESLALAGVYTTLTLAYYTIRDARSKNPDISITIKSANVIIGRDEDIIENDMGEVIDVINSTYSDFKFIIELQNKGHTSTQITDFKVKLSKIKATNRTWHFRRFEVPKRDVLEKEINFSLYCFFKEKNNPVTLEFKTLDRKKIKEKITIPKKSITFVDYRFGGGF